MKNYALDKESSKTFIMSYIKQNNNIIVKYGDKSTRSFPSTYEEEILNRMENQVKDKGKGTDIVLSPASLCKDKMNHSIVVAVAPLVFSFCCDLHYLDEILGNSGNLTLNTTAVSTASLALGIVITNMVLNQRLVSDIEKNSFYLEHKDIFNQYESKKDILKIKNKTKSKLEQGININNIDKLSYSELKKVKEAIDKSNRTKLSKKDKKKIKEIIFEAVENDISNNNLYKRLKK